MVLVIFLAFQKIKTDNQFINKINKERKKL